jgi:hypothetical protein
MNRLNDYTHKEIWSRRGKDFLIEVVRWETLTEEKYKKIKEEGYAFNGRFVWNIYCYLYPKHKKFNLPENEEYGECPINSFHYGCTYVNWHRKADGTITSKQYGNDYNHYGDECFTYIEKPEDAYTIFNDADELFEELS